VKNLWQENSKQSTAKGFIYKRVELTKLEVGQLPKDGEINLNSEDALTRPELSKRDGISMFTQGRIDYYGQKSNSENHGTGKRFTE